MRVFLWRTFHSTPLVVFLLPCSAGPAKWPTSSFLANGSALSLLSCLLGICVRSLLCLVLPSCLHLSYFFLVRSAVFGKRTTTFLSGKVSETFSDWTFSWLPCLVCSVDFTSLRGLAFNSAFMTFSCWSGVTAKSTIPPSVEESQSQSMTVYLGGCQDFWIPLSITYLLGSADWHVFSCTFVAALITNGLLLLTVGSDLVFAAVMMSLLFCWCHFLVSLFIFFSSGVTAKFTTSSSCGVLEIVTVYFSGCHPFFFSWFWLTCLLHLYSCFV